MVDAVCQVYRRTVPLFVKKDAFRRVGLLIGFQRFEVRVEFAYLLYDDLFSWEYLD